MTPRAEHHTAGRPSAEELNGALGDLRALIALAEKRGELEVIKGADPYLEMGALYELSLRAVLWPAVHGHDIDGHC